MRIPEKIKVGAHDVPVFGISMQHNESPGYYDTLYNQIGVRPRTEISESAQAEVLLHELMECICFRYEIHSFDHRDLTVLSEVLFQAMRDNGLNFCETSDDDEGDVDVALPDRNIIVRTTGQSKKVRQYLH